MKIRVEWMEHRRMQTDIEAESVEEVQENWDYGYASAMVDEIEDAGVEIDGGIDWNSVTIMEVKQ